MTKSKRNKQITLVCLVQGNTPACAFPININRNQLVGYLKELIKEKNHNSFALIDANHLKLWKVNIPSNKFPKLDLQSNSELLAAQTIGDYWTYAQKGHIHVIVLPPVTAGITADQKLNEKNIDKALNGTAALKKLPFVCKWSHSKQRRFNTQKKLKSHVEVEHKDDLTKLESFECPWDECNKSQGDLTELKEHLRKHTKQKPFKCPFSFCLYRFGSLNTLKRHLSVSHADVIVDPTGANDMTNFDEKNIKQEEDDTSDEDEYDDLYNSFKEEKESIRDDEMMFEALCEICDPELVKEMKAELNREWIGFR